MSGSAHFQVADGQRAGSGRPPRSGGGPTGLVAAGLLVLAACGGDPAPEPRSGGLPADTPVVMIVVDTLRADRLGCYGYELDTSPNVDALARSGSLFLSHVTQCNSTFPSMTSILTGLYPRTHHNYLAVPADGTGDDGLEWSTLAERLGAYGYYTASVWSHPMWNIHGEQSPVRRGWDTYSVIPREREGRNYDGNAAYTHERLLGALAEYAERSPRRPLLLWAHYFDPHGPYDPPLEIANRFLAPHLEALDLGAWEERLSAVPVRQRDAWIRRHADGDEEVALLLASGRVLYDAEIRFMDDWIGRLFEELDRRGLFEDALVLFLADHGENMGHSDRRTLAFTHERLFEGVVATPLIVRLPRQTEGRVVRGLSQNIDVLPTVLDLLGRPADDVEGQSLVPLLSGEREDVHLYAFSESSDLAERAVKSNEHKLIDPGTGADGLLYAWRDDPGEERELAGGGGGPRQELSAVLGAFRPADVLRLRLVPAGAPYPARVELAVPQTRIAGYDGPPEVAVADDGRSLVLDCTVGGEPVDVRVELEHLRTELRWRVDFDGRDEARRVRIGARGLDRSSALPLWGAPVGPAPADPVATLEREGDELELRVDRPPGASVEAEWRFRRSQYGQRIELVEAEGFGDLRRIHGGVFGQRAAVEGTLRTRLRVAADDPLLWLVRVDGRWADPARIAVDGHGVAGEDLSFLFPYPPDGRITTSLLTDPGDAVPPGSLCVWLESGGQRAELDTAGLDEETLESLRMLGYVK